MKIFKQLLYTVFSFFMLFTLTRTLVHQHKKYYNSPSSLLYSKGNAPDGVRSEIIQQLTKFQEGYTKRDTSQIKQFMDELFSKENVLILGTQPREICISHKAAMRLVFADWKQWGDCTFLINNSNISSAENVAWFSTIGYVKFDLSSLLVLPLRLTGIMVNENSIWKFQQMQFQFDLDLSNVLVTIIIIIIWFLMSLIWLTIIIIKRIRKHNEKS